MRIKLNKFPLFLLLCASSLFGAVKVQPFYVSKVSPSGNYSTKDFSILWAAFSEQYRLGPKGTFIQYPFARDTVRCAVTSPSYYSIGALFQEPRTGNSAGQLVGSQNNFRWENEQPLLTEAAAKDFVMQRRTSLVTLRVGNESLVTRPGAYECILVSKPVAFQEMDRDMRDVSVSTQQQNRATGPSFIYFADPAAPKQGEVQLRVSRDYYLSYSSEVAYYEVSKLQDTKQNQDNFLESLKAGSCFRIFTFKQTLCYNCGGLSRISMKSTNLIDEKCRVCAGTGRLPLGKVYALVWDKYIPSDEELRTSSGVR